MVDKSVVHIIYVIPLDLKFSIVKLIPWSFQIQKLFLVENLFFLVENFFASIVKRTYVTFSKAKE